MRARTRVRTGRMKTLAWTHFLAALILLGGTGTGRAMPSLILEGDNVIRIENLSVIDPSQNETIYNVDFVVTTALDLYGPDLEFDLAGENAGLGLAAVLDALNQNDPTPLGAGPSGSNLFQIGATDEGLDLIGAVGGEIFSGAWDRCAPFNCIAGVAILGEDETGTYAAFSVVPEPGTALLFGLGLAVLSTRRRV